MLKSLTSSLANFKEANFRPGLNIAIADRTKSSTVKDSRNAVGKTSFIQVLDFMLGSDARADHILRRPELIDATFSMEFEAAADNWHIERSGASASTIKVNSEVIKLAQYRALLGGLLFGLSGLDNEPSYRSLVAFYLRNANNGGFLNPVETYRKQSALDTAAPLAHLFGLDLDLVSRVKELADAKKSLRDLKRASRSPVLGMAMGKVRDLDAEIATLQVQLNRFTQRAENFQVLENYDENRVQADELSRLIRRLNDDITLAERNAKDLEIAISEENVEDRGYDHLRQVYAEIGVVLSEQVQRRFDEVQAFHLSVVSNRRRYLEAERTRLLAEASEKRQRLAEADQERSRLMRILQAGGALETFQEMQRQMVDIDSRLAELKRRRELIDRWEDSSRHLDLQSAELGLLFSAELEERRSQREFLAAKFSEIAYRLYGDKRPAALTIGTAEGGGYTFSPTLGGDNSGGVRSMAIFCFDVTMAVFARRNGLGPDFLIHDSHLFDGVEARQVREALEVGSELSTTEGLQYIVTMNSDDLDKALSVESKLNYHECAHMTDEYESGGLFGIRFN
ncbi:ABC-three component system protein [Actinokineospora sp. 24-640]